MDSEDGDLYIRNVSQLIRTHERALANAFLSQRHSKSDSSHRATIDAAPPQTRVTSSNKGQMLQSPALPANALATALSWGFSSTNVKPAKLTLTPHHLYYLLTRMEELEVTIGPLTVRLENIHTDVSPSNYVSFLGQQQRSRPQSDGDSVHSISSVRSVVSNFSSLWSLFTPNVSRSNTISEKSRTQSSADVTYLYSAFTKLPCLKLAPDPKARLIKGYEEFPFDAAVPLNAFKNMSALEISDIDFRRFYGWHILAEQLQSLILRRACVDDPTDALVAIVLDDMEKRRRRSSRTKASPTSPWPTTPITNLSEQAQEQVNLSSPATEEHVGQSRSAQNTCTHHRNTYTLVSSQSVQAISDSPTKRRSPSRPDGSSQHSHAKAPRGKRSASESSNSSVLSSGPLFSNSSIDLLSMGMLPASKWRFLRHLCLADNALTSLAVSSLAPLEQHLKSLDVSSNLFSEIPDCLTTLTNLKSLNISNCMIISLRNLTRCPLRKVSAINLRANRLTSLAGIEGSRGLERLDIRENHIYDSAKLGRLADMPHIQDLWIVGNPCTYSQKRYRIETFNLFRVTQYLNKDVAIDGIGPTYSEKRQLKDYSTPNQNGSNAGNECSTAEIAAATGNADTFNEQQAPSNKHSSPAIDEPQPIVILKSGKHVPRRRMVDRSGPGGRQGKETIHNHAPNIHNHLPQSLPANEQVSRLPVIYA